VVKRREALDKTDRRDHAQSLFTLDRNGQHRTDGRTLLPLDPLECPTCLCLCLHHAISFPLRSCTFLHVCCSYSTRAGTAQCVLKHPHARVKCHSALCTCNTSHLTKYTECITH
jgi:hypothetical protein